VGFMKDFSRISHTKKTTKGRDLVEAQSDKNGWMHGFIEPFRGTTHLTLCEYKGAIGEKGTRT